MRMASAPTRVGEHREEACLPHTGCRYRAAPRAHGARIMRSWKGLMFIFTFGLTRPAYASAAFRLTMAALGAHNEDHRPCATAA